MKATKSIEIGMLKFFMSWSSEKQRHRWSLESKTLSDPLKNRENINIIKQRGKVFSEIHRGKPRVDQCQ